MSLQVALSYVAFSNFFPKGTRVGISACVVGLDKALFGEDSDTFRPERWLSAQERKSVSWLSSCSNFMKKGKMIEVVCSSNY